MACMPDWDHVVLLHGLGRSVKIMDKMARYMKAHGFCPHNLDYPSTQKSVEEAAGLILQQFMKYIAGQIALMIF